MENGRIKIIKDAIEENYPELKKDTSLKFEKGHKVLNGMKEKTQPGHIQVKFQKCENLKRIQRNSRLFTSTVNNTAKNIL